MARDIAVGFVRGEAEAVRAVYKDYGNLVYAVAFKVLGDRSMAEERLRKRLYGRGGARPASTLPESSGRGWQRSPAGRLSTCTGGPLVGRTARWMRTRPTQWKYCRH